MCFPLWGFKIVKTGNFSQSGEIIILVLLLANGKEEENEKQKFQGTMHQDNIKKEQRSL